MSEPPHKPKLPRKVKVVIWTAGLVLAYAVVGFWIVPAVIKSQMLKRLPPLTKRQASVQEVTFNPFTLAFAMRGFSLTESNGEVFAGLDAFHLQFQALSSLSHRAWVFQDVTVTHPFAHVIRRKDGSFNFDNLLDTNAAPPAPGAPAGPPAALPEVEIGSLSIDGASLEADDLFPKTAFHHELKPINLQLTNFTIILHASSEFVFTASTEANEKFAAAGKITVQPPSALGNIKVTGVDLKRYAPYLAPFTTAELADGKLDVGANYNVALGPKGLEATVTNGIVQLTNLLVKAPNAGDTVVSIPSLTIALDEASLGKKAAYVTSIKSSGGSLRVRQNHDGTINLLSLLVKQAPPATAPTPATNAAAAPWTARVDEVAFDGYSVAVEDQKPARPVKLDVSALAFTVKGFNSATLAPLSTEMSMRLNGSGSLSVNGTVALTPISGDLTVALAGLDLPPFAPYIPSQIRIALAKGQLSVKGHAQGGIGLEGRVGVFEGDVSVNNFAANDMVEDESLVQFDTLAVTGIKASYPPVKLDVGEIALAGFNANAVVETNGQVNLLTIISNSPVNKSATPAPASASLPSIDLGALVIDKASLHYVDESMQPHATLDVQEVNGTIKGLSSHPQGPAAVDIRGNVGQFSPFTIDGTVAPLSRDISLDLVVSCKNLELTSMSPYMAKYGGHPLNKGKLLLDLKYDIAKRILTASNKVVVADLTLGPKNDSPNAVHLPVKLGVALLKDRHGNIDLDIPLSGSLDDPKFKILPIVWGVIENLLAKAATSPFSLLGRAVGGNGEELSSVDFAPGEAGLAPSEKAKLAKLAKALYERPALTMQIAGACAPKADGAVLARQLLRRQINQMRAEEEAAAGQSVETVESIKLSPPDYVRLLQKLYIREVGATGTNRPAPTVVSNAPPPLAVSATGKPPMEKLPRLYFVPAFSDSNPSGGGHLVKGGEKLIQHENAQRPPAEVAAANSAAPVPSSPAATPSTPSAPNMPDVPEMEQALLPKIRVPDNDLLDLMKARAQAVETALLASGQVPAERVFIVTAPLNPDAQGETRANFTLE